MAIPATVAKVGMSYLPAAIRPVETPPQNIGGGAADISAAAKFKRICRKALEARGAGDCWAGGDTGGWFGLP